MSEFTLVGVNPALEQFTDVACQLRHGAEEQARRLGRELGTAVTSAMAASCLRVLLLARTGGGTP